MFKFGLPPIPNDDHVKAFSKTFSQHKKSIDEIETDLNNYYQKSLLSFSKSTIEELQPIYENFIKSGVKFASSFGSFIQKFLPILKSASDLETKYSLMKQAFSNYIDSIKNVRSEETEENIENEKKNLLDFVEKFTRFNTDSNSLSVCFLMLYVASITQLSYDSSAFLQSLTKLIEGLPQITISKEEAEVDEIIIQLEKEIAEKKAHKEIKEKPNESIENQTMKEESQHINSSKPQDKEDTPQEIQQDNNCSQPQDKEDAPQEVKQVIQSNTNNEEEEKKEKIIPQNDSTKQDDAITSDQLTDDQEKDEQIDISTQ